MIKVHVEVSIDLSIYFSRILIKLGLYGLIRFYYFYNINFNFIMYIRVFGLFIISLFNFLNTDLKVFIAFSSIIYINISIFLVSSLNYYGLTGFYIINFFHSFSSIIYFISFGIFNFISKSRLIISNFGFVYIYLNIFYIFFVLMYLNLFSPLTLGFMGELFLFIFYFNYMSLFFIILCLIFIINLLYNIIYIVNLGYNTFYFYLYNDLKLVIYLLLSLIFIFNLFLFIKLDIFILY